MNCPIGNSADHRGVARNLDADFFEKSFRECADGNARGGLASACSFQYISQVVSVVLEPARKIRMTGPRPRKPSSALLICELARLDGHHVLPVLKIAIANQKRDWRPESLAVTNA